MKEISKETKKMVHKGVSLSCCAFLHSIITNNPKVFLQGILIFEMSTKM